MHYFEEEAFLHYTLFNFKELRYQFGDRLFDLMEKHDPETYEALKAHLANKEVEEFLSTPRKRDDDYYND
jgi:hypothetical protein